MPSKINSCISVIIKQDLNKKDRRYNFKKEEVMVFIKQQKYQHIVCKIKKGIIYFILDMKTILFICKTPKNEDY